jgi:D-alanine-D-alanine ligase
MTKTIVGVLRGGTSSEYDLSLKTGAAMIAALPQEHYEVRDIFIDKSGFWHLRGSPVTPARALSQLDVVLNALHGGIGEDGTVQRILHRAGIPYSGSSALASALSLNKVRAREIMQQAGVLMPQADSFLVSDNLNTGEMAKRVFSQFGPPYVIKPPTEGGSHGIAIAESLHTLPEVLGDVLDRYGAALVQQFIQGKEASVGVIEKFRNEELYALPPARVMVPQGARMLEFRHHEQGSLDHRVPSDFTDEQKQMLMHAARSAHRALGLGHFSRADFIVTPRTVYLLEINATPGLYPGASLPPMLESVGSSVGEFLEHAIKLAREAR